MFSNTLTLTASDTGVTLKTLLEALTGADKAEMPVIPRVACLKIGYFGEAGVWLVPKVGAYTTTVGNIPDQFGYSFMDQGTWFEMAYPQNSISLDEIIIGGVSGEVIHVFGYPI